MKSNIWDLIYKYISANPGDIQTISRKIWFNAYAENENIYIESASSHAPSSRITVRRRLDKENADTVYALYKKSADWKDVAKATRNYTYWQAIFAKAEL